MKHDRLFQILYILLEKKVVTASQLSNKLEVSIRTIYRDIDSLSACGIPIYALSGKNGGISLMSNYTFDKFMLSDKEQNMILFALNSLKATDQQMESIVDKLGASFKKEKCNWIEVDFSRWGHKVLDTQKFEMIKKAIIENKLLTINYIDGYGIKTDREIKAICLIFKSRDWYLKAYCMKANDYRTFKVNRMISLSLGEEYEKQDFINLENIEYTQPEQQEILQLKVSSKLGFRIYEEFLFDEIVKTNDGDLIVTTKFTPDEGVCNYILGFGNNVEILQPLWLIQQMKEYIKKMYYYYDVDKL